MKDYPLLQIERFDRGVALIRLSNPPLNLITPALMEQLRDSLQELAEDTSMRCVVLTGSTRAFCAGADVNTFQVFPRGTNATAGQFYYRSVEDCRLPIIAAIEGHCLGGGLELALCCDIRYASETASIGLVEANLSLIGAYGGMTRLPWLIGEGNAKLLFYTASKLSGAEAVRYGICQEVCPADQLLDKALELAHLIATKAPRSISVAKKIFHQYRHADFSAGFANEVAYGPFAAKSKDATEGIRAMKEKRTPVFKNE